MSKYNCLYLDCINRTTNKKLFEYVYSQISYYDTYVVIYHHFNDLKNNCKIIKTQYFNELEHLNNINSPFVD